MNIRRTIHAAAAARAVASAGPPAFNPLTMSGLVEAWDAEESASLGLTGANVNTWTGLIAGTVLTKSASGSAPTPPTLHATNLGGRPCVSFINTASMEGVLAAGASSPFSIVMVMQIRTMTTLDYTILMMTTVAPLADEDFVSIGAVSFSEADHYSKYGWSFDSIGDPITPDTPVVLSVVHNSTGTKHSAYQNSTSLAPEQYLTNLVTTGVISLGADWRAATNYGKTRLAHVGKIYMFNTALSDANRILLQDYLKTLYGIA